jgi:heterotetrameric sarcosine oxidase gamma subunit
VNTLDFLSVDAARPQDRFRPLARSPFLRRLGGGSEHGGWLVPGETGGNDAVSVRDVTHLHRVHESSDGVLVSFEPGDEREPVVVGWLWNGEERPPEDALDLSAGYGVLELAGPKVATLLRRLTDLDLERLPAAGAVAHVRAILIHDGEQTYRLLVEQELADYILEVVLDAIEPLRKDDE